MFSNNLTQQLFPLRFFFSSATKTICRNYYTPRDDAGVYRRLKALAEDEPTIKQEKISNRNMDDLEGNFMKSDEVHDEVFEKVASLSKRSQFKIIERKHFKIPKEPNMLTWSEKEHIKLIHQTNPEKWSEEALAESFPASPSIIKKILRTKWKPNSAEKLISHDNRVNENWKAFYCGKLEVHDPTLKAHLENFTERRNGINIISNEEAARITEVKLPRPKKTEFLSLVSNIENKDQGSSSAVPVIKTTENHSVLKTVQKSKPDYTLDQFKKRLGEVDKRSEEVNGIRLIAKENSSRSEPLQTYVPQSEGFKENASVIKKRIQSNLELKEIDSHLKRIDIPVKKRKPGAMYQVKDCFYNDKGYFVYRVPGLQQ